MPEETSNVTEIKTSSDGTVKISVEKYNELLADAARKPAVINRTNVIKTDEMLARECLLWGGGFVVLGSAFLVLGAGLIKVGLSK